MAGTLGTVTLKGSVVVDLGLKLSVIWDSGLSAAGSRIL